MLERTHGDFRLPAFTQCVIQCQETPTLFLFFRICSVFFLSFDHPVISAAIVYRFRLRHIHKLANSEIPLASNCLDGDRRNSVSDILKREMKLFLWDDSHTRWKHNWIFCEWKCAQLQKMISVFSLFDSHLFIGRIEITEPNKAIAGHGENERKKYIVFVQSRWMKRRTEYATKMDDFFLYFSLTFPVCFGQQCNK